MLELIRCGRLSDLILRAHPEPITHLEELDRDSVAEVNLFIEWRDEYNEPCTEARTVLMLLCPGEGNESNTGMLCFNFAPEVIRIDLQPDS